MDSPGPQRETNVLVAARYPAVRAGLRALLEDSAGLRVTGEAPLEGIEDAPLPPFDVLVADLGEDAEARLEELDEALPGVAAVILADWEAGSLGRSPASGVARGWLGRDATPQELTAAVHAVARGLAAIEPALLGLMLRAAPAPESTLDASLTEREHEVLLLVARGLPNKGIALELGISEHTAKFHVGAILSKLGAASRAEAVMAAVRRGILPL
ncbi:MAG: response regulator transcription factor [Chloroflexi bacterium]|nr:response regulator transcription factor [Chloroflexota bacterium]